MHCQNSSPKPVLLCLVNIRVTFRWCHWPCWDEGEDRNLCVVSLGQVLVLQWTDSKAQLGSCGAVNLFVKSSHFRMVAFSFLSFYLLCRRHSLSSFLMCYVFSWDMHRLMDSLLDLVLAPGLDFYNGLCTYQGLFSGISLSILCSLTVPVPLEQRLEISHLMWFKSLKCF